jgi:hypothetical protein
VQLTRVRDDPFVHYGDVVQLLHVESAAVLACDVQETVRRGGGWLAGWLAELQHSAWPHGSRSRSAAPTGRLLSAAG